MDVHVQIIKNKFVILLLQTPRIQQGKFSAWLCLPDEIMLQIFSFLSHGDLIEAALACKQYYRVALDETLCKYYLKEVKSSTHL